MKRLAVLDLGYLIAEKRETPMHVGGVHLFRLPEGADDQTFLHDLADRLRATDDFQPPFGDRLKTGPLGLKGPVYWEEDKSLDIDYHIRHSALPKPGRYRELFALVSRLHAQLLDRSRPLWEIYLIEGLENRQFAVYMKFHHSAIDGARSMHLAQMMYSPNQQHRMQYSPLSTQAADSYRAKLEKALPPAAPSEQELRNVAEVLKAQFDSGARVLDALRQVAKTFAFGGGTLQVPWREVPRSPINTEIDGARRFVAQSWSFDRIHAVGKALEGTFNDAILAMCSGALRAYLKDRHGLPKESLKAMVPISLRRPGDMDSANAVGAISADLATNLRNPVRRFKAIQASVAAGKELFGQLTPREGQLIMAILQAPGLAMMALGLSNRFPAYSTVISNVPGPRQPMYWNGALLEGMYPASIVFDGYALNITLVTCVDRVDFGIVACRRTMPQVQRLIEHLEDSLVELEQAAGIRTSASSAKKSKKRPAAKTRTATRASKKTKSTG